MLPDACLLGVTQHCGTQPPVFAFNSHVSGCFRFSLWGMLSCSGWSQYLEACCRTSCPAKPVFVLSSWKKTIGDSFCCLQFSIFCVALETSLPKGQGTIKQKWENKSASWWSSIQGDRFWLDLDRLSEEFSSNPELTSSLLLRSWPVGKSCLHSCCLCYLWSGRFLFRRKKPQVSHLIL